MDFYYAYGIRNSFGLAFNPLTEKLWNTENGEDEYDEIIIVNPGFNSGWQKIMGPAYRDANFSESELMMFKGAHYSDPVFSWKNSIGGSVRLLRMSKLILITTIIPFLMLLVSNVHAGGPRLDYDEAYADVPGAPECWVDGYDAGFAQKYGQDRADECADIPGDQYNASWGYGCIDSGLTEADCNDIKDNPQHIENHESLQQENRQGCFNDGYNDGIADNPFNRDRASGCSEYGGMYRDGYMSACQLDSTESSCELLIEGEKGYCPWHPDITACVEFLHNVTNKMPALTGICAGMGDPRPWVTCPQESNPERYCLNYNDPTFCKTIGDICDADGFVKPEYPYCTK